MANIFNVPKLKTDVYGKIILTIKETKDFDHLIGINVNDIILFDDGTDELIEQGTIILPRHYIIFVGTKDGELQYKPYEFNQYRIVVTTHKDIIINIDSIG